MYRWWLAVASLDTLLLSPNFSQAKNMTGKSQGNHITDNQTRSWHVFLSNHSSKPIYEPYISSFAQSIRRAWDVPLDSDISFPAYRELEFERAMDIIYRHQHPPDCMKAQYLISDGWGGGFASEFHVEG